jgi:hypothetical protein
MLSGCEELNKLNISEKTKSKETNITDITELNLNPENYLGKNITISGTAGQGSNTCYVQDKGEGIYHENYVLIDNEGYYIYATTKRIFEYGNTYTLSGVFGKGQILNNIPCYSVLEKY